MPTQVHNSDTLHDRFSLGLPAAAGCRSRGQAQRNVLGSFGERSLGLGPTESPSRTLTKSEEPRHASAASLRRGRSRLVVLSNAKGWLAGTCRAGGCRVPGRWAARPGDGGRSRASTREQHVATPMLCRTPVTRTRSGQTSSRGSADQHGC
jgi:hypothetical protein